MLRARGRVVAIALAAALITAACGDDDNAETTATRGTTETSTTASADLVDEERFCEIAAVFDQSENPFELPQDQARVAIPEKRAQMSEAARVAPDEIRAEVEIMVDAFLPIFDLFEEANFDFTQIDPAAFDAVAEAAYSGASDTAGAVMDEWIATNCSA